MLKRKNDRVEIDWKFVSSEIRLGVENYFRPIKIIDRHINGLRELAQERVLQQADVGGRTTADRQRFNPTPPAEDVGVIVFILIGMTMLIGLLAAQGHISLPFGG